ncbi:MAG: phosphomethylpyrimidine synthase ThiC [Candidatus Omnitrophica bacterium]|nr:phosphomethylpyrimidine synthase ThiC [Candidatus Omnitrophota bacterium]
MKTLVDIARTGKSTSLIGKIAKKENIDKKLLIKLISEGKVVIPANRKRSIKSPCGIGKMMRVKINANIGTSSDNIDLRGEIKKLKTAIFFGADTVMDLSVGGNIRKIQNSILAHSSVPIGTVPIYEASINAQKKYGSFLRMSKNDIFDVLKTQAENGVDFFTIHCGITKKTLNCLDNYPRLMGIVSRGGAMTARWIRKNKKENPLFEYFDNVLKIAREYDITLSLGDGLRPGTILDATDRPQIAELKLLGMLAEKAQKNGVQVMIEGPGHVPINQIKRNITLQKKYCYGAPFYVLGPLVTDIGLGYDHISAAIGSGIAAAYGADYLCFVTPAEHLKLPDIEDIKQGVIASKIAAHSGDLARGSTQAWAKDKMMSIARKKRKWQKQIAMSFDPEKARMGRASSIPKVKDACTMCGDFCSMKLMDGK